MAKLARVHVAGCGMQREAEAENEAIVRVCILYDGHIISSVCGIASSKSNAHLFPQNAAKPLAGAFAACAAFRVLVTDDLMVIWKLKLTDIEVVDISLVAVCRLAFSSTAASCDTSACGRVLPRTCGPTWERNLSLCHLASVSLSTRPLASQVFPQVDG